METCRRLGNYNGVASGCAQAAEKYLKALAERCLVDDPEAVTLLKTHNLRSLVNKLKEQIPGIPLDSRDCKWLGGFLFRRPLSRRQLRHSQRRRRPGMPAHHRTHPRDRKRGNRGVLKSFSRKMPWKGFFKRLYKKAFGCSGGHILQG